MWSRSSGAEILSWNPAAAGATVPYGRGNVKSVQFSPDGQHILTASAGDVYVLGSAHIWRADTAELVGSLSKIFDSQFFPEIYSILFGRLLDLLQLRALGGGAQKNIHDNKLHQLHSIHKNFLYGSF